MRHGSPPFRLLSYRGIPATGGLAPPGGGAAAALAGRGRRVALAGLLRARFIRAGASGRATVLSCVGRRREQAGCCRRVRLGARGAIRRAGRSAARTGLATARLRVRGLDDPAQRTGGSPGFGNRSRSRPLDWQNLIRRLAPLRTRWDVALLANLTGSDAPVRPVDLINAVNAQSDDGQLSWKVMEDRLRHLEASGYIARREVPHGPRESRYWLLPRGDRLLSALDLLDTWYDDQDPGTGDDTPSG